MQIFTKISCIASRPQDTDADDSSLSSLGSGRLPSGGNLAISSTMKPTRATA